VSFSNVAQNITCAAYKGVGRWEWGCQRSCQWSPNHIARQSKPLAIVLDDWEQLHTNATLLKPAKHCHSLFRALQGHEKAIWKSRPGYL